MTRAFKNLARAFQSVTAPLRAFGHALTGLSDLPDAVDLWCCRRYAQDAIRSMHPDLNVIDREDLLDREDRAVLDSMRAVSSSLRMSGDVLLAGKAAADAMGDDEWRRRAESSRFFPRVVPDHVLVWEVMES